MKEREVVAQTARISKYRELEKMRDEIYAALKVITEPRDVPGEQSPFTGNTRESRQIRSMKISFTETRGGAPAVEIEVPTMHIGASELGRAIESMLRAKLAVVSAEMEKL